MRTDIQLFRERNVGCEGGGGCGGVGGCGGGGWDLFELPGRVQTLSNKCMCAYLKVFQNTGKSL